MLDPLLGPFVEAADDSEAERQLNTLVVQRALPLANAIVARKLGAFGAHASGPSEFQDREDVVNEALATLVERLWRARAGDEDEPIESFERYAATVIYSTCAHAIRRRHPERVRLKNRLRYVCATDVRLALWTTGDLVCGLRAWQGRPAHDTSHQALRRHVERESRDWLSMDRTRFSRAIVDVIGASGGPVAFDTLVAVLSVDLVEPRHVTEASTVMPSPEPTQDRVVEQRRFLEQVWDEVRQLPVRQRLALLLNLRDDSGAGVLWLLPIAGVATIRQIARVLEIRDDEFARLWHELPLSDSAIAGRLGCDRQQVINLRVSARKRVLNRVKRLLQPIAPRAGERANLIAVSASMKGRA